jgi:hypothetical protein
MSWQPHNFQTNPDPIIAKFDQVILDLSRASDDEILTAAMASPAVHFSLFCRIKDEDNRIISPRPNVLQLRMAETYETLKSIGIRVRILVTKPRRAGCSSFVEHIGYHDAMRRPIEGLTIADDKEGSKAAMAKLQSYGEYDSYPWKITVVQDSTASISWSNGSKWTVDTARNPDAGAGDTRQFGHMSETSKWPQTTTLNDERTMTCAMPTFSGMDTTVFSESTPEKAAGWQYKTWGKEAMWLDEFLARWKQGFRPEEQWIKVFAAWYEFEKNCRRDKCSAAEIREMEETLTDIEVSEIEKYKLTWEQVAWRRETIKNKCNGSEKIFSFYYPSDPVSCWLAGGSSQFDMQRLVEMENLAMTMTPERGYLIEQIDKQVSFAMQHDGTGDIEIWEHPIIGCRYLGALDPATDKSQTVSADPDRHSIAIWRAGYHDTAHDVWRNAKLVARVKAPYYADGDEVADHMIRLSRYFGTCLVAQEVMCGLDILKRLQAAGIPCYKRRPLSARTKSIVEQYGFKLTSGEDRTAVIDRYTAAIREKAVDVPCLHTIEEYKSFIVNLAKGRAEAAGGCHDDDVMRDVMAWECMGQATPYKITKAQNVEPRDEGRNGWRAVSAYKR